jgi:hypothetical protein
MPSRGSRQVTPIYALIEATKQKRHESADPGRRPSSHASAILRRNAYLDCRLEAGRDAAINRRKRIDSSSELPVIGRNAGGAADFEVGTIFDDIIDARDRSDVIHGALGDDVPMGGIGDDGIYGESGNDDLFGGSGGDMVAGGLGDDFVQGGYGRDYLSGGDSIDTLSYQGEFRAVNVDLDRGTVYSDGTVNGVTLVDPATTFQLPTGVQNQALINDIGGAASTTGGNPNLEDLLGNLLEVNHALEMRDGMDTFTGMDRASSSRT